MSRSLRLFSSFLIVISFLIFSTSEVFASLVTETFDDSNDISSLEGAEITGGELVISNDGVTYSEDFNSYSNGEVPTDWVRDTTGWVIEDDTYTHVNNNYDESTTHWEGQMVKNGDITVDMNILGGEGVGGIAFRMQDSDSFYMAAFSPRYDFVGVTKVVNGTHTSVFNKAYTFEWDTYYTFRVVYNHSSIKVYVDDVLEIDITDASFPDAGYVGSWRNGTGMRLDNLSIASADYWTGCATSVAFSESSQIRGVTLESMTGTNLDGVDITVSNDNGLNWRTIGDGDTVLFDSEGYSIKYIACIKDSSSIDLLNFETNSSAIDGLYYSKNRDLTHVHYNEFGNSVYEGSLNPADLELYETLVDVAVVQQSAIVFRDGKTIAYIPDSSSASPELNRLIAYNLTDKEILWERLLEAYVENTPFVFNDKIYIGTYPNKFWVLNQDDGSVDWTFDSDNAISGAPIDIKDNLVYFADYGYSGTTKLYAVNMTTHILEWSYSVPYATHLSFTVDHFSDRIYVTFGSNLYCFEATTGDEIWGYDLIWGSILTQPAVHGKYLVIGADRGVGVLNRYTGDPIWKNDDDFLLAGDGVGATPVVKNSVVYYPTKTDANVYARSLIDGSLIWKTPVTDVIGTFSSPVLTDDGYLYASYNTGMRAFDVSDGSLVWTSDQLSWIENVPTIAHGYLIFTDPAGAGTTYVYKSNRETFVSYSGFSLMRDDRIVTSILTDGSPSITFDCSSGEIYINDVGEVEISYGELSSRIIKPSDMIMNIVNGSSIYACHPSGSGISFSYDFETTVFTDILRDGLVMNRSAWELNGTVLSVTDSFSGHLYVLTTIEEQEEEPEDEQVDDTPLSEDQEAVEDQEIAPVFDELADVGANVFLILLFYFSTFIGISVLINYFSKKKSLVY